MCDHTFTPHISRRVFTHQHFLLLLSDIALIPQVLMTCSRSQNPLSVKINNIQPQLRDNSMTNI